MNAPTTKTEFDIDQIDAALETEKATKKAALKKRKKGFVLLAAFVLKAGAAYAGYSWFHAGVIETDKASVGADTATVTPLVAGHVARV